MSRRVGAIAGVVRRLRWPALWAVVVLVGALSCVGLYFDWYRLVSVAALGVALAAGTAFITRVLGRARQVSAVLLALADMLVLAALIYLPEYETAAGLLLVVLLLVTGLFALWASTEIQFQRRWIRPSTTVAVPPSAPIKATSPARSPTPAWSLANVPLDEVVSDALRLATRECSGEPLTTGGILAALMRMDVRTDWERIWLHTGEPEDIRLSQAPDPPIGPAADWRGIPVTNCVYRAFSRIHQLCRKYSWDSAGSGATMLALVSERSYGATDALLRHGGLTHSRLLRLVQDDILNTRLQGLTAIIPSATE